MTPYIFEFYESGPSHGSETLRYQVRAEFLSEAEDIVIKHMDMEDGNAARNQLKRMKRTMRLVDTSWSPKGL